MLLRRISYAEILICFYLHINGIDILEFLGLLYFGFDKIYNFNKENLPYSEKDSNCENKTYI